MAKEIEFRQYIKTEKLEILHDLKLRLDDVYYNEGISSISDMQYDMLKDMLKERDPYYIPPVGVKIRIGENRATLPFWLGSADKITPSEIEVLERWIANNPATSHIISEKLDGISGLLIYKNGKTNLYTRGNGIIGVDISHLIQYIKNIPKVSSEKVLAIRGELIIKKEVFKSYQKDYANPRSMIIGMKGAKTVRKGFNDIDFIAYEIVTDVAPKISTQFQKLKEMGFDVVKHQKVTSVSIKTLTSLYTSIRDHSEYEIDGIMIQSNVEYDRVTSGNPDYMFAFKMITDIRKTVVKHVEWEMSKWGRLKPVVVVEPVKLESITIKRVTAYNAKYVEDNGLGPNAIITVTRSKEVIPCIIEVLEKTEPQFPTIPYVWDKNHVDIVAKTAENIMCIKLISGLFASLGIKHVAEATIKTMMENGLDNLFKILDASKKRLLEIPEFHEKSAERIHTNIHKGLQNVNISTVLGKSGIFGFGIGARRVEMLFLDIPNLLELYKTQSTAQIKETIMKVEGFSDLTADKIVGNLKYADKFITKLQKYATFKKEKRVSDSLKSHKYVMTGFRDKKLEDDIKERGGKVTSTVSRNTTGLIVAVMASKLTGKLLKASELGVPIYTKSDFAEQFIS